MLKILPNITSSADLKKINRTDLALVVQEIRDEIINLVATKEGHLGASLGVVELTVALHYYYDTPHVPLIWDVGHQAYGHKLLTGRYHSFQTNRQWNGISGFPKRTESIYDSFGTGHSSTSISAALGIALGLQHSGKSDIPTIAVIGDASIVSGMAFEALNHAGATNANIIVILNDNAMAIDHSVGAIHQYLKNVKIHPNNGFAPIIKALNFYYYGMVDGHDMESLLTAFNHLKEINGPKFLHLRTTKGKGLKLAEENQIVYHAPGKFDVKTGELLKKNNSNFSIKYQDIFGKTILALAQKYNDLFAITPAMPSGSSLYMMMNEFPDRAIDVGIAEQHAVTLSAGLAIQNLKVFCCIYSTFLQRAYDQVIHDVALQNIPLVFFIDRAGLVGEDGATHQGVFDIVYLLPIPNMIIWVPKDAKQLRQSIINAYHHQHSPLAIRYPRGNSGDMDWEIPLELNDIKKWDLVQAGRKVLVISLGIISQEVTNALNALQLDWAHIVVFQIKPLNINDWKEILQQVTHIITVEEGVIIGGFGHYVAQLLNNLGQFHYMHYGVPDQFIEHGTINEQWEYCGISKNALIKKFSKINDAL